jgi:hypothetical protein
MLLAEPPEFNPPKLVGDHFGKKAGKITKQQCPIYPSLPFRGFYGKSLGRNDGNFQQVMEGDKKKRHPLADLVN